MLSWNVFYEDINKRSIIIKDIFDGGYYERVARDLKAKLADKSAFADSFRNELMRQFGGRAEYEIVITSWPPHVNVDDITTVQKRIEAEEAAWGKKPNMTIVPLSCNRKVDIFEQLDLNWDQFIDYIWTNI